jgi:dihydrofolate reductase
MTESKPERGAAPGRPRISIVVARARNGVIGRDNALPWHLPEDLRHFKKTTLGHPVLMGRRTFESIGRPLPGRRNLVLTRDARWSHAGCEPVRSLDEAVSLCSGLPELFVIGGAQVYDEALALADRLIVTRIDAEPEGDATFPEPDVSQWRQVHTQPGRSASGLAFEIVEFERVR